MINGKHIIRAVLLLLVVAGIVDLGRRLLVPDSFNVYGHYRADNLVEQRMHPIQFATGLTSDCEMCHDEKAKTLLNSRHKNMTCVNCHGPLASHITRTKSDKMGQKTGKMKAESSWKHCARCHQKQTARAGKLPQVEVVEHLKMQGVALGERVCLDCHNPHNPSPK